MKSDKLSVGSWNKLPHISVVGEATEFYVWVNEDGRGESSDWIRGREAFELYGNLIQLRKKDKQGFIDEVKRLFEKHRSR